MLCALRQFCLPIILTEINEKTLTSNLLFSSQTAPNKETSESPILVWIHCPNKHAITEKEQVQKYAFQISLLNSKIFHAYLRYFK